MVDCYTCDFTVACARRIKKKKKIESTANVTQCERLVWKGTELSFSKKKKVYQSFFRSLPHNRCSGLIPSIQKTVSPLWSKLTRNRTDTEAWGPPGSRVSSPLATGRVQRITGQRRRLLRLLLRGAGRRVPAGGPPRTPSVCRADHSTEGTAVRGSARRCPEMALSDVFFNLITFFY